MLNRMRENALAMSADKHHQIELDVPEGARLVANPAELESAFGNLITNAVKYTPDGGRIRIHWWQDDNGAHLSVTDNGKIDPAHSPPHRTLLPPGQQPRDPDWRHRAGARHRQARDAPPWWQLEIKSQLGQGRLYLPLPGSQTGEQAHSGGGLS